MKTKLALLLSILFVLISLAPVALADSDDSALGAFSTIDLYGEEVTSDIFALADITLINIWGTFCPPCLAEMPDLGDLNREYADRRFQIVGIVVDVDNLDMLALALEIIEATGADYLHILPDEVMIRAKLYSVTAIPETIFVDSAGRQIGKSIIGSLPRDKWVEVIEQMLGEFADEASDALQ